MSSTRKRTFVKALTYRAIVVPTDAVAVTAMAVFYFHLPVWEALLTLGSITTIMELTFHTAIYYLHDRAFKHIKWGKVEE